MDWIKRIVLGASIAAIAVSLPAVGNARPCFRQPTDRIAFTDSTCYCIATTAPDGSQRLELPGYQYHLYSSWSPAWSPDGTKIADVANYPTGWVLVVRNSDGSGYPLLILAAGGADRRTIYSPRWSPDGTRILYTASFDGGNGRDVFVVDADGTGRRQLTTDGNTLDPDYGKPGHMRTLATNTAASWSPDGKRIVFERTHYGDDPYEHLFTIRADGGGLRQLTSGGGFEPQWSPDGKEIAFEDHGIVSTIRPDGGGLRQLAPKVSYARGPQWSPDGTRIAFADVGDDGGIDVVDRDGAKVTKLPNTQTGDSQLAWSPDGTRIAFTRSSTIYTIAANGGGVQHVADSARDPAWLQAASARPPAY